MKRPIRVLFVDYSCTLADDSETVLSTHNAIRDMYDKDWIGLDRFREDIMYASTYLDNYREWGIIDEEPTAEERGENYIGFLYENLYQTMGKLIEPFPYEDAEETLSRIRDMGIEIIVISLHPQKSLEKELKMFGLYKYVSRAYGDVHNKDKKLVEVMHESGINPEEAAYMGDTPHDIISAERAGVASIAKYGSAYATKESVDEALEGLRKRGHPSLAVHNLKDIVERIQKQPYLILET